MPGTDLEQIVGEVMDRWKSGVDSHQPDLVAEQFTEDTVFQGLRPYSVGRQGVYAYYDGQPPGMTVAYHVLETRRVSTEAVLGYLHADFSFPDRDTVSVRIGVLVTRGADRWRIAYYQASRTD